MPLYTFYKIICNDDNIKDCYVGSTKDLRRRWIEHKSCCNNEKRKEYNFKLYQFIRENGYIDNWDIIEIEKNECDDKNEADLKERLLIEELNANLNTYIPLRTKKEYYENNKEKIKERNKEYYEKNIEKIKEYYENNKENRKEYKKEYYDNNREKLKQRDKEYRDKNKEKLNEKFICCCGGKYTKTGKSKHFKTKLHQEYLLNENN